MQVGSCIREFPPMMLYVWRYYQELDLFSTCYIPGIIYALSFAPHKDPPSVYPYINEETGIQRSNLQSSNGCKLNHANRTQTPGISARHFSGALRSRCCPWCFLHHKLSPICLCTVIFSSPIKLLKLFKSETWSGSLWILDHMQNPASVERITYT